MISYKEHFDGACTHQEFYEQFASKAVQKRVLRTISLERLLASTDPHMNDIALNVWDLVAPDCLDISSVERGKTGTCGSKSTGVCIAKAAAIKIIKQHNAAITLTPEQQKKIKCYDNGGKTIDRYTVVFMEQPEQDEEIYEALGMSANPFTGVGMSCSAHPGSHLGKKIAFDELPVDCRKLVTSRI